MNIDLTGKHAVVCGSSQGIGAATARTLSNLGASVTLIARNEEKLKNVLASLQAHAENDYIVADFTQPEDLQKKITEWAKQHTAHILVNNTGGPKGGPIVDAAVDEFYSAFTMHLICNHILVQALYPGMKEAGYGRIINVISTSVKQPIPGLGVSNTIRGAVANWSKTLANELGAFGITVNNVLPGYTDTVRIRAIAENKIKQNPGLTMDEVYQNFANNTPAKRIAQPQELADVISFLASPSAGYVNGINVPVDGGRTASL